MTNPFTNIYLFSDTSNILNCLKNPKPFSDEKLRALSVTTRDFELAVPDVQPSAKREGFATVPDVTWNDIGALEKIREELSIAILVSCSLYTESNLLIVSSLGTCTKPGCIYSFGSHTCVWCTASRSSRMWKDIVGESNCQ